MLNHLYILLELYPDIWNYSLLSENTSVTCEILEIFPDRGWDYQKLSRNPNMKWSYIDKNMDKNWNWNLLAETIPLSIDIINKYNLNPKYLSENKHLTREIYLKFLNWNHYYISEQSWLTWDLILNKPIKWHWRKILANKNLTWEIIQKNIKYIKNKSKVSFKYIFKNPNIYNHLSYFKDIDYPNLSCNPELTWSYVSQNLDKPWSWGILSKKINIEIIIKNPDCDWSYAIMSYNPTLTWRVVKQNLDKLWSWGIIIRNFVTPRRYIKYSKYIDSVYPDIDFKKFRNFKYIYWDTIDIKGNLTDINTYNYGYRAMIILNLCRKYWNIWFQKYQRNKNQRKLWKLNFTGSIDYLNLKF